MSDLKSYIAEAREKGISDKDIKQNLLSEGWDKSSVETGLSGLSVPKPPSAPGKSTHSTDDKVSIGPLQAALHHVLLWFFLGSSTISIISVVLSLFGQSVSVTALATMIAVTIVTFIPYAFFFILYLKKVRKEPQIIPSKVWTIITLCLVSVGAMGYAIGLVISTVNDADASIIVGLVLSLLLLVITLVVYGFAAFSTEKLEKVRKIILIAALPAFAILIGTLFVMSLLQLGPAQHDENLRKNLASSASAVHKYVKANDALPQLLEAKSLLTDSSITYSPKSSSTYELCAPFKTKGYSQNTSYYEDSLQRNVNDSYVSEYDFRSESSGTQCFIVESNLLSSPLYKNN